MRDVVHTHHPEIIQFKQEINGMSDTATLLELKNQLKDKIVQPIEWKMRMTLYLKVQIINERLIQLQEC